MNQVDDLVFQPRKRRRADDEPEFSEDTTNNVLKSFNLQEAEEIPHLMTSKIIPALRNQAARKNNGHIQCFEANSQ